MRNRALAAVAVVVAIGAATLTGCTTPRSSSTELAVVASTTQVGDFVREIGGDEIALTTLLNPGASAHAFEPTQADMIALADADLFVINGLDLEPFVDEAIATSGFQGTVIDASSGIHLDEHAQPEEGTDGHDHAGANPHIWTSPILASEMVGTIAAGMEQASPEQAETFAANAEAYQAQLAVLDVWIAENMARVPEAERVFVSGHNSLEYFLDEYGIRFVGSILPSFEDNAEPSVAQIEQLIQDIRDSGVKAIFVESSMNPKIAQQIADESGATLLSHDVIYADSLGGPGSGAETYIAATVHNTQVILEAWGYTPTPVPAELKVSGT